VPEALAEATREAVENVKRFMAGESVKGVFRREEYLFWPLLRSAGNYPPSGTCVESAWAGHRPVLEKEQGMTEGKEVTLDMYHCARITSW